MGAEAQTCQDHEPFTGAPGTEPPEETDAASRQPPGAWAPKSGQGAIQPERLRQR